MGACVGGKWCTLLARRWTGAKKNQTAYASLRAGKLTTMLYIILTGVTFFMVVIMFNE
jgi:hypothetical protein